MKYFLDDTRTTDMVYDDPTWILLRDPTELVTLFKQHHDRITHISFDHDLNWFVDGEEITGYTTLQAIIDHRSNDGFELGSYSVHYAFPFC